MSKLQSPSEISAIRQIFEMIDANNDGYITSAEIGLALRGLGCFLTEADIGELRVEISKNYQGKISFNDFARIHAMKRQDSISEDVVRDFFKAFDRNKDGFIDISELKHMLTNMGEPMSIPEVTQVMAEFDINDDGRLSIDEFARMVVEKDISFS